MTSMGHGTPKLDRRTMEKCNYLFRKLIFWVKLVIKVKFNIGGYYLLMKGTSKLKVDKL